MVHLLGILTTGSVKVQLRSVVFRHMLNNQMPQARPGVRRVAIVMTDGNSQETEKTKKAASDARESGLEVFAIGLGINVSAQELHNIASDDRSVAPDLNVTNKQACAVPPVNILYHAILFFPCS